MRSAGGRSRRPGGLLVLLAFFLSLLPAAAQASISAVPDQPMVVQLVDALALEASLQATVPQTAEAAELERSGFDDPGTAALRPQLPAGSAIGAAARHFLPPATAPPAGAQSQAYKARAPPIC